MAWGIAWTIVWVYLIGHGDAGNISYGQFRGIDGELVLLILEGFLTKLDK